MKIMQFLEQVLSPADKLTAFKNEAHRRLEKTNYKTASRKFLFIIADSGGGHRTTANAVKAEILARDPEACVYLMPAVDILNHPQRLMSRGIEEAYNQAIKMGTYWMEPMLFNSVYFMELPVVHQYIALRNAQIIDTFQPESIVAFVPATQELTYHALEFLKQDKTIPLYSVITDLISMRHNWLIPEQAGAFITTHKAHQYFLDLGIPPEKMQVTGLPVHPRFYEPSPSKAELQARFGLDPERFTLLMLMGANGSQSMFHYCRLIEKLNLPVQVVACCGHSKGLKKSIDLFARQSSMPIHTMGFTREIPDLMAVSDLLLTKPGSVTLAESISKGLPVLIDASSYVMMQEQGNDAFFEAHKLGKVFRSRQELKGLLSLLIQDPDKYAELKHHMQNFPKPNATAHIAQTLLNQRFEGAQHLL